MQLLCENSCTAECLASTPWRLHALQVLGASDSVKGKAIQHRLEMKGSVPPWVLDRFTAVIKDAHPAKFQVHHRK